MLSKNLQALLFKGHVTSLNGSMHVAFSLDTSILVFPRAQDGEFPNELWGQVWWAKLVLFSIHKGIMKRPRTCYPTEHATNDYKLDQIGMYPCTHATNCWMLPYRTCYPSKFPIQRQNESFGRSHRFPLPDLLAVPCRYQPKNMCATEHIILTRKWWTQVIYTDYISYLSNVLLGRFCRNVIKIRMVVDTR